MILCSAILVLGGIFYLGRAEVARADHGTHLLISQVQITGGAGQTNDDFVEIYNPTGSAIDLDGMRLVKRMASGTSDIRIKSWTNTALVPAHGYYLWANSGFTGISATPDETTAGTLAADNAVALRAGPADTGEIVDAVGWDAAANALVEGTAFPSNPGANESIERLPGGGEGNGTDTDNNTADFVLRVSAVPRNTTSAPVPDLPEPPGPVCGNSVCEAGEDYNSCSADCTAPPPEPSYIPGNIVVNEFVPNPVDGVEWIEIYNRTGSTIDLQSWRIFDGTGNSVVSLSGTLSAGGFLAFDLSSARLNNSGDIIELRAPSGAVIDSVTYGNWDDGATSDNAPAPEQAGQSLARKSNGVDTGNDADDFAFSDGPTKGASNVIATTEIITQGGTDVADEPRTVASARIVINEFVSDPADGEEWVELFNIGDVAVTFDGWWIEEGAGSKTALSGTFIPGQFFVAEGIKGNLNNSGDIIMLKDPDGSVIDRVTYGAWEDGARGDNAPAASDPNSAARRQDGADTGVDAEDFTVTTTPTKGAPNRVAAAEAQSEAVREILFSEVMPNPEGSDETEWIELFNASNVGVSLSGARIEDSSGASYTFGAGGTTVGGGFFVVRREESRIALNNTSETLSLYAPDDTLLDRVQWTGAKEGLAFARDSSAWRWTSRLTPGSVNLFDAPEAEPAAFIQDEEAERSDAASGASAVAALHEVYGQLLISELLPDPVGSDSGEWIELFWNGSAEIDLSGFALDDAEGGSKPRILEGVRIKAGAFAVFPKSLTGLTLNNGGDTVRLYEPSGALIDSIEYEGSVEGRAFARRTDAHWFWTAPSPGARNVFDTGAVADADTADEDERVSSSVRKSAAVLNSTVGEARELEAGMRVRLEGIIVVLPDVFSSQYFYIVEDNAGLPAQAGVQVYSFKKDFPELKVGDRVRVQGEISLPGGQTRVKTKTAADIVVVGNGPAPEPLEVSADMLGEDLEGALLRIFGTVIDTTSSGIILDDGTGEALIHIKGATGIDDRELVPGVELAVAGILEQTRSGYRILPRFEEDVEVLGKDALLLGKEQDVPESQNGASSPYAKATAVAGGGAALTGLAIRRRKLFVNGLRAAAFLLRRGRST